MPSRASVGRVEQLAETGPTSLPVGTTVGPYKISERVATGADSTVYRAIHSNGQGVVLKELAPSGCVLRSGSEIRSRPGGAADFAAARVRFGAEAAALADVHSPRVPRLLEVLEANGTVYLAMQAMAGRSLAESLAGGTAPDEAALTTLLRQLGDALAEIHAAGLLHRDVKPANVVLDRESGAAALVDLGAAAAPGAIAAGPSHLTPGYGALEQYVADGNEGPWTDVYGLAALAYRVVAGAPPPSAAERLTRDDMAPASTLGRGRFSADLLGAIDRGLALAPDRRPQTVASWLDAFAMTDLEDPIAPSAQATDSTDDFAPTVAVERRPAPPPPVRPAGLIQPQAKAPRRLGRHWIVGGALLLLALVIAAALALFGPDYYRRNIKSEWLVDAAGNGDTATIMEALRDAKADSIVRVRPGTYRESVALVRPVSLVGAPDAPETVIVAPEAGVCLASGVERGLVAGFAFQGAAAPDTENGPPCIVVTAGVLRLDHVVAQGADGPALLIAGDAAPSVTNSRLLGGAGSALTIDQGAGQIAENEIVGGAKPAVVLRARADPTIRENTITGGDSVALLATAGARGRFEKNTIDAPLGSGIEIRRGADPVFSGNRIEGAGEAGIFVHQGGRGTYSDNTVMASAFSGVVVGLGAAPDMTANLIQGSGEHGVILLDGAAGRLERNVVRDNDGYGIAVVTGALTELVDNDVSGNREPQVYEGVLVAAPDGE